MENGKRSKSSRSADAAYKARWPEIADRGFTAVPKCLITCPGALGLTSQEVGVLLCIIERYWYVDDDIFPKVETVAAELGKGYSTITRTIEQLKKKGFLDTKRRHNSSNLYYLDKLDEKLKEHLNSCPKMSSTINSKSSTTYCSKVSSDIEAPNNLEKLDVDSLNSQRFINEVVDKSLNKNILGMPYPVKKKGYHEHEWHPIHEKDVYDMYGSPAVDRYYECEWCDEKWHERVDKNGQTSLDENLYDDEDVIDL